MFKSRLLSMILPFMIALHERSYYLSDNYLQVLISAISRLVLNFFGNLYVEIMVQG